MKDICIRLLDALPEIREKIDNSTSFSLTSVYTNVQYQELLETLFGKEGNVTTTITENNALSLVERSLFLQLAIYCNHTVFYKLLDHMYALDLDKHRGYNWELLTALKTINDHCYNTPARATKDYDTYTEAPVLSILFTNLLSGGMVISAQNVQLAIRCLIAESICDLDQKINLSAYDYKSAQKSVILLLDNVTPNGMWRLIKSGLTVQQITEGGEDVQGMYYSYRHRLTTDLENQIAEHSRSCTSASCFNGMMLQNMLITYNRTLDENILEDEKRLLSDSNTRYKAEVNVAQEATKSRNSCTIS